MIKEARQWRNSKIERWWTSLANEARKKGKKGRKIGRQSRKPSHVKYTQERRWEKNKARKQAKIQKELERKKARKLRKARNNE